LPEVLNNAAEPGEETSLENGMHRVKCKRCGKTLMFVKPSGTEQADCAVVEIKCRNRECREVNRIKLCHLICE